MAYLPHCVIDGKKVAHMYTMVSDLCFACSLYHLEEGNIYVQNCTLWKMIYVLLALCITWKKATYVHLGT